jgi:transcriptional regulator with XRE-family HTH domain
MIDNEVISRIAQKIRATRLQKNLTIQQLATRMHVSKGLLSKIENSKTIPSLPVFVTLLQSLDISLKEFFEDMLLINGREFVLVKKDHFKSKDGASQNGFVYQHILSQNISYCTMEASLLTIEPGSKGKMTTSDGYKFNYILCGSCESQINNDLIQLDEGDAVYLDASVPQTLINNTRKKVSLLVVAFIVRLQKRL